MTVPNPLLVQPYPAAYLTLIPAPSPCTLPVPYQRANNPEWPLPSREHEAAGPGDHKEWIGPRWHQATPVVHSEKLVVLSFVQRHGGYWQCKLLAFVQPEEL